jgi:hypothetical protein
MIAEIESRCRWIIQSVRGIVGREGRGWMQGVASCGTCGPVDPPRADEWEG